ncbi:membrane-anchored protein [Rhizobiaceae bacterium n13]|uniref:Membrane-anchored protein n=1 Tax=Ferirhizobium litorale TaxID=2927786 RepID=A0AAE3U3L1_9HYPH|nr:membrane-anchored protein [Fererhizobium litorale]MDI7862213.1 membrane-anchored protein [Fererhizobium litorale]MDI7922513.1 membrane-anchored protein [Fererhizobium litorale]
MASSLFRAKQHIYRSIKYRLRRPQAPVLREKLAGRTVVIVGSAPVSTKPEGLDDSFRVLTINASQVVAQGWGIEQPDVTLMQFNQIEGTNTNAVEVRRVLSHQRTGLLYMLLWRHGLDRLKAGLEAFDYRYEDLRLIDRYERVELIRQVTGVLNFELEAESKWSNGIIGTVLAIHSGAKNVILTGINPNSSGHIYNNENLNRLHASKDLEMLLRLRDMQCPIFTADEIVARDTGLPLWRNQGTESASIAPGEKAR